MLKNKFISLSIIFLFIFSSFAGAICISNKSNIKKENERYTSLSKGIGGWHSEESLQVDGKNFEDVEKIGGNGGGWESPYETNSIRIWAEENRVRAKYLFDIDEGPVKYLKYDILYKDVGWFSDGPDALVYNWDDTWGSYSNIGGAGEDNDNYEWETHTFTTNSDKYVNSKGEILVGAQAYDDSSVFHQDDLAIKIMKISYKAADEEIFNVEYQPYDSNDDGAKDSIKAKIDADVGNDGDGTSVNVKAICYLKDPSGNIIDSNQKTWLITDHQVEYGIINTSSLGGNNGMYSLEIKLIDEYGNLEDETSKSIYLVPDPKRTVDFYVSPIEGGSILLEQSTYYDNESTLLSNKEYDISALSEEYYAFDKWECTGGVSVEHYNSKDTKMTVNNNGSIKAVFTFEFNTLYFFVQPDFSGYIKVEDNDFTNNSGCYIDSGKYSLEAVSTDDSYYFSEWYVEGDISVEDEYISQTVLDVFGDGILLAIFNENNPPNKPELPDGALSGAIYESYSYSTKTTDSNKDQIYYLFDWNDGTDSGWLGPYESDEKCTAAHSWGGSRTYQVRVKAKDSHGSESEWSDPISVGIFSPPSSPKIKGPTHGEIKKEYDFTFSSTDPDSDDVYFYIEWGDNNIEDWVGPYNSGEEVTISHSFRRKGTFTIKALAKDENEVVSQSWGMLVIDCPKTKKYNFNFLDFLIEKSIFIRLVEKIQFLSLFDFLN